MGMQLLPQFPQEDLRRAFNVFDDFDKFSSASTALWTSVVTNSSTPTLSATLEDGVLVALNTGATNDASFTFTSNPVFLWGSKQPHVCEFLLQFSEASTNQANIWCGFSSVNTVAQLVNASAGPATSFTGAGIYKQGGSTTWRTISSQSTTQNLNNTIYTAGQAGYTRLRVEMRCVNGIMEICYFIDQGGSSGNAAGMVPMKTSLMLPPIKDYITLSSPAAMYLGFGVKNGSANAETLNVDYASGWKLRTNFLAST